MSPDEIDDLIDTLGIEKVRGIVVTNWQREAQRTGKSCGGCGQDFADGDPRFLAESATLRKATGNGRFVICWECEDRRRADDDQFGSVKAALDGVWEGDHCAGCGCPFDHWWSGVRTSHYPDQLRDEEYVCSFNCYHRFYYRYVRTDGGRVTRAKYGRTSRCQRDGCDNYLDSDRDRADKKYCSGACRVAAHRARTKPTR